MTAPPPPPEASLIRVARQARGLSPERAAVLTRIRLGGSRWREIERGYKGRDTGKFVRAPSLTLAHMAQVVGVSPERLDEAGRRDAADILREIQRQEAEQEAQPYADLSDRLERAIWEIPGLAEEDKIMIIDALRRRPGREGGVSRSA